MLKRFVIEITHNGEEYEFLKTLSFKKKHRKNEEIHKPNTNSIIRSLENRG